MSIQRLLFSLTRSCNATVLSINFSVNITNKKVIGTQIHNGSFIYAETRDSGVFGLSDIRVVNPDHSRQGQQQEQYQKSQDERENGVENGDDGDDGQNSSPKVFGLRHGLGSIWANYCHARIWVNCTEKIISPSYSIYNDLKIDYKISITERIHNSAENNDGENKDSWAPSVLALTLIDSSNSDATIDDEYLGYKGKTSHSSLLPAFNNCL
ncbi:hypothetical protein AX774_g1082 [Zancudomyces culisetae]|uniref:Uncharacterized protein n=1 Tax=Zancudomyces culisetae TaxID=1213189 RepID=A0A1R1PWQ6_ZANCU|nr:hypothetical protein AX774_g1082 [Zancudomyces culisetae]|eukprot:OMH85374.1 hypothetical protein AX774_g1082 [Zancudomyces culisetae]